MKMLLKNKIEVLRYELDKKISEGHKLNTEEILKSSQELDKLIELYHYSIYDIDKNAK